MIANVN